MPDVYFTDGASFGAIEAVVKDLREIERRDFETLFPSALVGITQCVAVCEIAKTAYADGQPVAIFGLHRESSVEGVPWLAMTNSGAAHSLTFVKQARFWVERFRQKYPYLRNHVPAEDQPAIDLLEVCEFTVDEEVVNIRGMDYRAFWSGRRV